MRPGEQDDPIMRATRRFLPLTAATFGRDDEPAEQADVVIVNMRRTSEFEIAYRVAKLAIEDCAFNFQMFRSPVRELRKTSKHISIAGNQTNGFGLRESRIGEIFGSMSEFRAIRRRCAASVECGCREHNEQVHQHEKRP
jgi:hypothetical protein